MRVGHVRGAHTDTAAEHTGNIIRALGFELPRGRGDPSAGLGRKAASANGTDFERRA